MILQPPLTYKSSRNYVVPVGAATVLDLGCLTVALLVLDVSFRTVIEGATLVSLFSEH